MFISGKPILTVLAEKDTEIQRLKELLDASKDNSLRAANDLAEERRRYQIEIGTLKADLALLIESNKSLIDTNAALDTHVKRLQTQVENLQASNDDLQKLVNDKVYIQARERVKRLESLVLQTLWADPEERPELLCDADFTDEIRATWNKSREQFNCRLSLFEIQTVLARVTRTGNNIVHREWANEQIPNKEEFIEQVLSQFDFNNHERAKRVMSFALSL